MSETISLFLTTAQKSKMVAKKPFQMSATQLKAGSGKHEVEIQMAVKNYKTLLRNVEKGKGFRFTSAIIGGAVVDTPEPVVDTPEPVVSEKTGGKLVKGSQAMKDHMAKLRGMRKGKGMKAEEILGEGVFGDIERGLKKTFNPALGRKIKSAVRSPVGKKILKTIADAGIAGVSTISGNPILGLVGSQAVNGLIDGMGVGKRRYAKKNLMVEGGTLVGGVPSVMKMSGKSVKVGGSFRSAGGTLYGGSMVSP